MKKMLHNQISQCPYLLGCHAKRRASCTNGDHPDCTFYQTEEKEAGERAEGAEEGPKSRLPHLLQLVRE